MSELFKLKVSIGTTNIELEGDSEIVTSIFSDIRENGLGKLTSYKVCLPVEQKVDEVQTNESIPNSNAEPPSLPKELEALSNNTTVTEISMNDFHIKTRRFLDSNKISVDMLNHLYYKDGNSLMPLYETLNSTKMSECQVRLALLSAFENSFGSDDGTMSFNGEEVRKRCQDMKCYDSANFSTIFKNSKDQFDNWNEKYEKNQNYTLSIAGKNELATTLKSLVEE